MQTPLNRRSSLRQRVTTRTVGHSGESRLWRQVSRRTGEFSRHEEDPPLLRGCDVGSAGGRAGDQGMGYHLRRVKAPVTGSAGSGRDFSRHEGDPPLLRGCTVRNTESRARGQGVRYLLLFLRKRCDKSSSGCPTSVGQAHNAITENGDCEPKTGPLGTGTTRLKMCWVTGWLEG